MKEIVKRDWAELASIWNELFDQNPVASPFQSYEFLSLTGKGKPQREDLFRTLGLKELNVVLYKDHQPVAIAPMLFKTKKGKTIVYFRGHFTVANHLDLIYAALDYEDFQFLMDGIRDMLGGVSFFLDRVYCQSPTSGYLKQYLSSAEIQEHECFAIPIPIHYEDWYCGLHKSHRQKINNTNNRIAKDDILCETTFVVGEQVDSAIYNKMILVYADRFMVKNNFGCGPFHSIVKKILQIFLLHDKITQWLKTADQRVHVIVTMNNEIAAFTSGLICKDKRILCSRLAINTKYGRYSPGAVLLSSIVGYLAQQREAGKTDVEKLDLSQGCRSGMNYKTAYGGEVYYNYTFME